MGTWIHGHVGTFTAISQHSQRHCKSRCRHYVMKHPLSDCYSISLSLDTKIQCHDYCDVYSICYTITLDVVEFEFGQQ